MKIRFNGDRKFILAQIKKIMPDSRLVFRNGSFDLDGYEKGYVYNFLPKIENIKGVIGIDLKNEDLIPLCCSYRAPQKINKSIPLIIARPCVIHSWDDFFETAKELEKLKIYAIRAPLFKPRSSPYGWDGYGAKGIKRLREIKKNIRTPFVMEIIDYRIIDSVSDVCDIIQIGARNMRNYTLLKEAAESKKTVLLKREPRANLKEFLYSAEYLLKYSCRNIILCERGDNLSDDIASIDTEMIKMIKKETDMPVIADVSHSSKRRERVMGFVKKTVNYADGIMIETSVNPSASPIDTKQIVDLDEFKKILKIVR
jgi:3-deoxy-7-phosphoheptulonate synthase